MNFIKLTNTDNTIIYINRNLILEIEKHSGSSRIWFEKRSLWVKETPEYILGLHEKKE